MDARENKLSSCKIPDQLKNKKVIKILELRTLWLKKEKKRENSQFKRVVITTLKIANTKELLLQL